MLTLYLRHETNKHQGVNKNKTHPAQPPAKQTTRPARNAPERHELRREGPGHLVVVEAARGKDHALAADARGREGADVGLRDVADIHRL